MGIDELRFVGHETSVLQSTAGLSPVIITYDANAGGGSANQIADAADIIKRAAYTVGLVLLRNVAPFSRSEFVELGNHFGQLEDITQINEKADKPEGDPAWYIEEMRRSAMSDAGEQPGIQRGVHQDRAYVDPPTDISMLRILESSTLGGNTNFVDMRSLYDILMQPGEMNDLVVAESDGEHSLDTLQVSHSYSDASLAVRDSKDTGESLLPLVLQHPVTGKRAIFYSEANALRIYGVSRQLGRLLDSRIVGLLGGDFSIKGALVPRYSHIWKVENGYGDIAIWDNRVVGHASTSGRGSRYGERVTMRDGGRLAVLSSSD